MIMKKLLGSVAVVAAVTLIAGPAFAAAGQLSDSLVNTRENLISLPVFINYASYIIGTALGVAGVSKLKAHVDNPGQTPIKDGLGRIGAAGLFISLPFLLDMIRATQSVGSGMGSYQKIGALAP
jgi:hypothetical protein